MISYELARKLKDAGLPQRGDGVLKAVKENGLPGVAYYPTLSELIEACGDRFRSLVREPQPNGGVSWWCESKYPHSYLNYASPDEAVANLYLALHGNGQNNKA